MLKLVIVNSEGTIMSLLVKERVFNDMQCHILAYLFTKLRCHHQGLEETYYNDAIKLFVYYLIETINFDAVNYTTS